MRVVLLASLVVLTACEGGEDTTAPVENSVGNEITNEIAAPSAAASAEIDGEALANVLYAELQDDLSAPDGLKLQTGATDLDGDGEAEVLAYAIDRNICGSGGCSLYVLRKAGNSYRILDQIGPSRLPVYKLGKGADGWAELGVTVAGGGMAQAVMAVPHDEAGYAGNPTVAPSRAVEAGNAEVIIAQPVQN